VGHQLLCNISTAAVDSFHKQTDILTEKKIKSEIHRLRGKRDMSCLKGTGKLSVRSLTGAVALSN